MDRWRQTVGIVLGVVTIAACGVAEKGRSDQPPPPSAVSCQDAAQLRQRAADDRRLSVGSSSDQDKVVAGSRATFYAALATVAALKCEVTMPAADEALQPAFDAARTAHAAGTFYEEAVQWGDAAFVTTQVVPMLVQQRAGQPK
jgi:hypothetical protein